VKYLIKKEAILLTAVLSLLALASFPRAQATGEMTIQVYPNTVTITPANMTSTFQIEIRMIDAHDVAGIQFRVEWNSSILTCKTIVRPTGHFMDPDGTEEAEGNLWVIYTRKGTGYGEYAVTYYDMQAAQTRGTVPRTGNGILATLTMNATGTLGTTTIHFNPDETIIGDVNSQPITTILDDGTVIVIPELNLAILALLLPTIALAVIAARKFLPKKN
jgi:hypothetical protein